MEVITVINTMKEKMVLSVLFGLGASEGLEEVEPEIRKMSQESKGESCSRQRNSKMLAEEVG